MALQRAWNRLTYRRVAGPIRILHLLDTDADYQTERSLASLRARLGAAFIQETTRVQPQISRESAATILALRRESSRDFDLIHAWGPRALSFAALGTHLPIVYTPRPVPKHNDIRWVRAVSAYRRVHAIFATSTQRRMHIERGMSPERCQVVRPGVDFSGIKRRRDPALRKRFGFNNDDRVLYACGESTRAANHRDTVWAFAILHLLDPRYKLLLSGRGEAVGSVRHFVSRSPLSGAVAFANDQLPDVSLEALLPAIDGVLVNAGGAIETLPIAVAMAAGLPIVSTVTYTTSELLEDRHSALMVAPGKPRQFARRVMDLFEDPQLQFSIAETARGEAYEYHSLTRFIEEFRTCYRTIAGREREIHEPRASVALRELESV